MVWKRVQEFEFLPWPYWGYWIGITSLNPNLVCCALPSFHSFGACYNQISLLKHFFYIIKQIIQNIKLYYSCWCSSKWLQNLHKILFKYLLIAPKRLGIRFLYKTWPNLRNIVIDYWMWHKSNFFLISISYNWE